MSLISAGSISLDSTFKSIGTVLLEKKISFWIFFVLSACLETTRKVSDGISGKYVSIYGENKNLELFAVNKIISE